MNVLFSDFSLYGRRALRVSLQADGHPDLVLDLVPDLRPPKAEAIKHTNLVPTSHTFRIRSVFGVLLFFGGLTLSRFVAAFKRLFIQIIRNTHPFL